MGRQRKKPIAYTGAPHSLFRRMTRRRRAAPLAGADQDTGNGIRALLAFLGRLFESALAFLGLLGRDTLPFLGRVCGGALGFLGRLERDTLAFLGWLWAGAVGFAQRRLTGRVSSVDRIGSDWQFWRLRHNVDRIESGPDNPYPKPKPKARP